MNWFYELIVKRIRDVILGLSCLCLGIYMVVTNNYNEIAIIIISVVAFVYAVFGDRA